MGKRKNSNSILCPPTSSPLLEFVMGKRKSSKMSVISLPPATHPLLEFVQKYESLPELWDQKNCNYLKKAKRNEAYLELLKIFMKIKPNSDIGAVKKKINSLRSNYRKELKKIEDSKVNGETYKPNHWLFYALHRFLHNLDGQSRKSMDMAAETEDEHSVDGQKISYDSEETLEFQIETVEPALLQDIKPLASFVNKAAQNDILQPPSKLQRLSMSENSSNYEHSFESVPSEEHFNTLQATMVTPLSPSSPTLPTIVKVWGEKFIQLDPQQRNFAEKAINDILFEAGQGTLTRYSVKIN